MFLKCFHGIEIVLKILRYKYHSSSSTANFTNQSMNIHDMTYIECACAWNQKRHAHAQTLILIAMCFPVKYDRWRKHGKQTIQVTCKCMHKMAYSSIVELCGRYLGNDAIDRHYRKVPGTGLTVSAVRAIVYIQFLLVKQQFEMSPSQGWSRYRIISWILSRHYRWQQYI
jgi:hypothetical protein